MRIGIQIRPFIWFLTPFKKEEINKVKYFFLCFELVLYKSPNNK